MRKLLVVFSIFSLFLFSSAIVRASMPTNVDVTITSSFDGENSGIAFGSPQSKAVGSLLSLDASTVQPTHNFAFWVINGVVRNDLLATSQIRVQSTMDVHAVFYKTGEHAVLFVDSNGKLMSVQYVLDGNDATAPSYADKTKPGMILDTVTPWKTLDGLTSLIGIDWGALST